LKNGCAKKACALAALLEEYPDILKPKTNENIAILSAYQNKNSDILGMIRFFEDY
jgi:fructose-1-phosphate kinase PfkB-like protein